MIESYGWSPDLQAGFHAFVADGLSPARIVVQQRSHYRLITPIGEVTAQLSGRFLFGSLNENHPVTGDWVAVSLREQERGATIHHLLPRRSAFVRKAAGNEPVSQVVAANIDAVLIVTSLNTDLNLRRLERTLAMARESGARPVVILTKADICEDVATQMQHVVSVAGGAGILPVSAVTGVGMTELRALIPAGTTAVVVGSSGVGKSTLVNALLGDERMATRAIRASDERGQHTTSHRELILLPQGGCILDTPGMRELGLWEVDAGLSATFTDIETLAAQCRFGNCSHRTEPGCAVQQALADGGLEPGRWRNYVKLQSELVLKERRETLQAMAVRKKGRPGSAHPTRRGTHDWQDD